MIDRLGDLAMSWISEEFNPTRLSRERPHLIHFLLEAKAASSEGKDQRNGLVVMKRSESRLLRKRLQWQLFTTGPFFLLLKKNTERHRMISLVGDVVWIYFYSQALVRV